MDDSFDDNIIVEDDHVEEVDDETNNEEDDEKVTKNIFDMTPAVTTNNQQLNAVSNLYAQTETSADDQHVEPAEETNLTTTDFQIQANNNEAKQHVKRNLEQQSSVAKSQKNDVIVDAKCMEDTFGKSDFIYNNKLG